MVETLELIRREIALREYRWGLGALRYAEVLVSARAEYEAGLRRDYPAMQGAA